MRPLDWGVVATYMALTLAIGLWLSRRASRSLEDFFVGGRSIPWWLAGARSIVSAWGGEPAMQQAAARWLMRQS